LKKRNKPIRIAEKSDGDRKTVDEFLSDEVASDSEDEKRIRAAENRAVRKIKAGKKNDKTSRNRPVEAAGAPALPIHNGGNSSTVLPFVQQELSSQLSKIPRRMTNALHAPPLDIGPVTARRRKDQRFQRTCCLSATIKNFARYRV